MGNYRTTPHTTTGKSPAEIMFSNRAFETTIPDPIDNRIIDPIDTLLWSKSLYCLE